MKNIIEILSDMGITVPEDKHAELSKAVSKNYKTIAEHENKVNKLTEERDSAVETLKGFEGKDFEAITRERDEWQRKHKELEESHKKEREEREFNDILSTAITEAKGKNAKAIMALLDMEKLRSSRNQQADIKAALDALRNDSGYLFDDNGGKPRFAKPNDGGNLGGSTLTKEDIMKIPDRTERRAAMAKNFHLFNNIKGD